MSTIAKVKNLTIVDTLIDILVGFEIFYEGSAQKYNFSSVVDVDDSNMIILMDQIYQQYLC